VNNQYTIFWFRQDLRLSDNPALSAAVDSGNVVPIYILDDDHAGDMKMGAASRWWLHHSLVALNQTLGGKLQFFSGPAGQVLEGLCEQYDIKALYWNRCYEPWRIKRDAKIQAELSDEGIEVQSYNGSLLWEPWQVLKKDATAYKVFTPYYKKGCLSNAPPVRAPLPAPVNQNILSLNASDLEVNDLALLPQVEWCMSLRTCWDIGEQGAQNAMKTFFEAGIDDYETGRNFPGKNKISRLSPYLHWGEISPHQLWYSVHQIGDDDNIERFKSELGWREFSYYQLYHFPRLPRDNFQNKFDFFPWCDNKEKLLAWQRGQTGYPIIDAGMRELWQTGFMHNRVRMIVASFLVKNLLIHWHHGADWFWDCLVDADLASNSASWQWVAGCGADAAPYFRIFNPIIQGERFDKNGDYTRRYVPELSAMPTKFLFKPWEAPSEVLADAGVKLGANYPLPIVDISSSRKAALDAYQQIRLLHAVEHKSQ